MTTTPLDPFEQQHAGIVEVHGMLKTAFEALAQGAAAPLDALVGQAKGAGGFLLAHHDVESKVLFPGLRRLGKLKSTDVAFLERCDCEHVELHHLAERLLAEAASAQPSAERIAGLARETVAAFGPHTQEEEVGLAAPRLREMLSLAGLEEIGRELVELRARYAAAGVGPAPVRPPGAR